VNDGADVLAAPCAGSYVGGDITAGVFASMMNRRPDMSLFIDLGTNGELVYGGAEFLVACACSAGPAFEGGDISCGMRAAYGAIEAFRIDGATLEPTLTVIGAPDAKPAGICGSGLIDIVCELFRAGVIDAKGRIVREGARIIRDDTGLSSYVLAFAGETGIGRNIEINETDIDNFIRAKGSIYSAIRCLLATTDTRESELDAVYVAGGIGSGIDIGSAIRIGMLPNLPAERFHYLGNTSLTGAYAMLMSRNANAEVNNVCDGMTYLELSAYPGYMDEFVAACFLPHTDASLFPAAEAERT
ncbi:MAG: ASKHA domain-containing protein, partial [Synergistaceae bacterium]|nr:ASKHA domain-containing protein [Synergistaceae bacterium]